MSDSLACDVCGKTFKEVCESLMGCRNSKCPLTKTLSGESNPADYYDVVSDGSTASYYELPSNASELQQLISYKNMNAQIGEIFRAAYRYGQSSHSDQLRDAKKILFYIEAEIERLKRYGQGT